MPNHFEALPRDILYRIFSYLAKSDALCLPPKANKGRGWKAEEQDRTLSNLCLVSETCREAAQPLIFRRVLLSSESDGDRFASTRTRIQGSRLEALLSFLRLHPRVARFITTLEVFAQNIKAQPSVVPQLLVDGILGECKNLHQLWLFMVHARTRSDRRTLQAIRRYLDSPDHHITSLKLYINDFADFECLPEIRTIPYLYIGIDLDALDELFVPNSQYLQARSASANERLVKVRPTVLRLYGWSTGCFRRDRYDLGSFLDVFEPPHTLSLRKCYVTFTDFAALMNWVGHSLQHLDCRNLQFLQWERENSPEIWLSTESSHHFLESYASAVPKLKSVAFSRYLTSGLHPLGCVETLEFEAFDYISLADVKRWLASTNSPYGRHLRKIVLKDGSRSAVNRGALDELLELSRNLGFRVLMND